MDAARRNAIHEAMVRLSDGDRTAFDLVLDELWPVLRSFALRGLRHSADAEDVAQETFYKICANIGDFDRRRDGLSWAFGIASHELMTHRRRQQRRREVPHDASVTATADSAASQEAQLVDRDILSALEEALGALTEEDRRTLGVHAAPTNATGPTQRKRRQRALERLRDLWRRRHGEP